MQSRQAKFSGTLEYAVIVHFPALIIAHDHDDDFAILAGRRVKFSGNDP